ncbi:MAG TPA: PilT/PilU family type 4a pilus ATPase [Thermoanaerobaculia bacterium]|jgi:twitching motility protein PilT|nr:PilT/PilU family type 4a pilus ATPase [Thermoanaerobaculia bacterium]
MSEHLRDPELDRLVHELNSRAELAKPGEAGAPESGEGGDESGFGAGPSAGAADAAPAAGYLAAPVASPERHAGGPASRPERAEAAAWLELLPEPPPRASLEAGDALGGILAEAVRRGASDLLLLPGLPPVFRVDGRLKRGEAEPLDADDLARLFQPQLASRVRREIEERGAADFSLRLAATAAAPPASPGGMAGLPGTTGTTGGRLDASGAAAWRFRVNLHRQRGQLAAAVRTLPRDIPTLGGLNLPPAFAELVKPSRGLVLVCGPTGSGKSSTLAALIGEINRGRTAHIITIEDPVEYEHRSNRSLIEHVEVGRDARSFSEALRAALRQDPDVILVGEMRDLETMATAISAAETGHLVLATLHSNDAVQSVHRIVDVFPPSQQAQIRQQLALSLHAIVAQQLVPRADGRGRIPAVELMLATFAVRHHIRSDKLEKLYNEITLGKRQGMTSFEESLALLVREGKIDLEEARVRASHPEELDTRLRG